MQPKQLIREVWRSAPRCVQDPVYIQQVKKYWIEENCIFIHVPKAAGTSVCDALYGRHLYHFKAREIQRYAPMVFRSVLKFTLVRNPWSRALSAYRFALAGGTSVMGISNPAQYQIPAFGSFESFLTEWLPNQDMRKIDQIFQSQVPFVRGSNGDIIVDHLGRVEAIGETEEYLSHYLKRRIVFPKINSTGEGSDSYRNAYTDPRMCEVVQNIYAEDIETFGYSF